MKASILRSWTTDAMEIPDYYPPPPPAWPPPEPIVYGDAAECHFCGTRLPDADLFVYYVERAKWEAGEEVVDFEQWTAGGEVVPVCQACRTDIATEYEPEEVLDGIDRWYTRMMWTFLLIIIAMVAYAITQ